MTWLWIFASAMVGIGIGYVIGRWNDNEGQRQYFLTAFRSGTLADEFDDSELAPHE